MLDGLTPHIQRLKLLLPFKSLIFFSLTVMVVTVFFQLSIPKVIEYYVDNAAVLSLLSANTLWTMVGVLSFSCLCALRFYLFELLGLKVIARFKKELHQKLLRMSNTFYDQNNMAELSGRLMADTERLKEIVTTDLALFLRATLMSIGCIVMMFQISFELSIILLVSIPILVVFTKVLGSKLAHYSASIQSELANSNKVAFDNLNCHSLVKLYDAHAKANLEYNNAIYMHVSESKKGNKVIALYQGSFNFLMYSCLFIILSMGTLLISKNSITIGDLTAYTLYSGMVLMNFSGVSGFWTEWMQTIGATNYVFDILNNEDDLEPFSKNKLSLKGRVTFEHVSFYYPNKPEELIIDDISFSLNQGEKLVLKGSSGNGKTTIAKLLMGFYLPTAGKIILNGVDLCKNNINDFRHSIAYVEQDPLLFSTSIFDNICLSGDIGSEIELRKKVKEACIKANIHEFIESLPQGYDSLVGDRGAQLSGGQKQRIAIARALLKDADIIILDEYTSALDDKNRALLDDAINNLVGLKTVIVISHNQSQVDTLGSILTI